MSSDRLSSFNPLPSVLELNIVREKLVDFQETILNDVKQNANRLLDELLHEMQQRQIVSTTIEDNSNWINRAHQNEIPEQLSTNPVSQVLLLSSSTSSLKSTNNLKIKQHSSNEKHQIQNSNVKQDSPQFQRLQRPLPEKVFILRDSYLTALFTVNHIRAIYHVFLVIFSIFCLHIITHDYFTKERLQFGLKTWQSGFGQFSTIFLFWLAQQLFVISLWPALRFWARIKSKLFLHNKSLQLVWSYTCLSLYIMSQICFQAIPCWLCVSLHLPFATSIALQLDTVRLLMKMHAFVRTNVPNLMCKNEDETDENKLRMPPITNYIYFLFAPTLIYRDYYPCNAYIRWKFVMARFIEIIAIIFLHTFIYEIFIKNIFSDIGLRSWTRTEFLLKFITALMPYNLLLLADFYLILHVWHNFTGELLKFGDRMFYKDWWTATNYETYFRNWNVIVHDWLYEYIYKDFYRFIFKGNKLLSSLAVFTISALYHEICINFSLRLFFPATYIFFGIFGVLLVFITRLIPKNIGNILLWFTLIFGNGMLITLYSMEYYGKINCPKVIFKWYDHILPHIWYCYQKTL